MKRLKLDIDTLAVDSFTVDPARRTRGTVLGAEATVGWTCDGGWTCGCPPIESQGYTFCNADDTCRASCLGTCIPDPGCGPDNPDTTGCTPSQPSEIWTCQVGC